MYMIADVDERKKDEKQLTRVAEKGTFDYV